MDVPFVTREILWGFVRLGLVALLGIPIFTLIFYNHLKIAKEMVIALIRGSVQLMLMTVALVLIFEMADSADPMMRVLYPVTLAVVFVVMILTGGYTAFKRAKDVPHAFPLITISLTIGTLFTLGWLFLVIFPWKPQYIIPMTGMAIGNAMNMVALTLDRFTAQMKDQKDKIETMLALGATSNQATRKLSSIAMETAMMPSLNSLKTLGVVFIPGAMVGLLMAGEEPLIAAQYQITVYFMIFSAGIISSTIAMALAKRWLFTPAHQLNF